MTKLILHGQINRSLKYLPLLTMVCLPNTLILSLKYISWANIGSWYIFYLLPIELSDFFSLTYLSIHFETCYFLYNGGKGFDIYKTKY